MASRRDQLMKSFMNRRKRIQEDDPRWNPATMGNKTGHKGQAYYVGGRQVRGPLRG